MDYDVKIDKRGTKRYYVNNVLHREDGPAIEKSNGTKFWYKNGKLHREDGPAIESAYGHQCWYLNDICYGYNNDFSASVWKSFIKTLIFS